MNDTDLLHQFSQWIDDALSSSLLEGVVAFNFNMYDTSTSHDIELVGCLVYDPKNEDWACDPVFMSKKPRFEIPHADEDENWEQGLERATQMLRAYVAGDSTGARRLREAQAVCVGFVDGHLKGVWSRGDA